MLIYICFFYYVHSRGRCYAHKFQVQRTRMLPTVETSDIELVNALVGRDTRSFATFYNRYCKLIRHCISSRTDMDADDLLQIFFAKLHEKGYRQLDGWDRKSRLSGYLAFLVRNFVIDQWRKSPNAKYKFEELKDLDLEEANTAPGTMPDAAYESLQLRRRGITAWSKLPTPRDRHLICNHYHRETPPHLAALSVGLTDGAFRTALSRANHRYLELLRKTAPEYF